MNSDFEIQRASSDSYNLIISIIKESQNMNRAPHITTRVGEWYETVIAIGDDNVAYLTMHKDDLIALCERNGISTEWVK